MRILVTGSNGMLGSDLVAELSPKYEVSGLGKQPNAHERISYAQADIASPAQVLKAVKSLKPAIIVHTAAYTDVDGCESNPFQAFQVNVKGTEAIAEAADACGATLFFISSDYVFDGAKPSPYTEEDQPNPLSVYGRSKYEAEEWLKSNGRSVRIIRSSWLFGRNGRNFFRSILQAISHGGPLRVVRDQKGAPTYTKDLAGGIRLLIEKACRIEGCQIYHLANRGATTWFDAALRILKKTRSKVEAIPITSQELDWPAKRPQNSTLDQSRIKKEFGIALRPWDQAFDDYWSEALESEWQNLIALQKS